MCVKEWLKRYGRQKMARKEMLAWIGCYGVAGENGFRGCLSRNSWHRNFRLRPEEQEETETVLPSRALYRCTALHCTTLRCTVLHCTTLYLMQWSALYVDRLHCIFIHWIVLHYMHCADVPCFTQATDDSEPFLPGLPRLPPPSAHLEIWPYIIEYISMLHQVWPWAWKYGGVPYAELFYWLWFTHRKSKGW